MNDQLFDTIAEAPNATAFTEVRTALTELGTADVETRITTLLDVFVHTVTADPVTTTGSVSAADVSNPDAAAARDSV